jgi:hypothetical protein
MRRGRILIALAAVGAVVLVTAAAAVAASPRQIYSDLAQHGKLTKHYSAADLRRASKDATLQGYGGVGSNVTPAGQGVAGVSKSGGVAGKVSPIAATGTSGSLPFTGVQLGVFVALGLVLLTGGLLLRRAGRNRPGA